MKVKKDLSISVIWQKIVGDFLTEWQTKGLELYSDDNGKYVLKSRKGEEQKIRRREKK